MPFKDDNLDDLNPRDEGLPEPAEELEQRPESEVPTREVQIVGLFEEAGQSYFVLLRDNRDRQLPIQIGPFETQAIAFAMQGERITPRPMTHDLLKNVIERLGAKVYRLTIDSLFQETYYAKLSLLVGDEIIEIDTRPSDGIALALRCRAPISVAEDILEEAERQHEAGDADADSDVTPE